MINTLNNKMLGFRKEFILKFKQKFNVSHFIPFHVKKLIQNICIKYGLFSQTF